MGINESLEEKRLVAINLIDKIQRTLTEVNKIKEEIVKIHSSIEVKDKNFRKKIIKISQLEEEADTVIRNFDETKNKLISLLQQIEKYYLNKFLPLQVKIDDPANGLKSKLQESLKQASEIKKITTFCNQKVAEIRSDVFGLKKESTKLKTISRAIEGLKSKSESNKEIIENLKINIQKVDKSISEIFLKIQNEYKSAKDANEVILKLKDNSEECVATITTIKNESEEKLKSIQDIYEIAHETGLSGEFEKRRNQHFKEKNKWSNWVVGTSITLLAGLIALYICQLWLNKWKLNETLDLNFYIRFLILSPIVFILFFTSSQYAKEKALYDKYSFKTTMAMSIKAHIDLLTKLETLNIQDNSNRIVKFIVECFEKIYNEPFDEEYRVRLKVEDIELNLEKKLLDKIGVKHNQKDLFPNMS